MKLQLALDVGKKDALRIALKTKKYIDIIEIGTPLIKVEGLGVLNKFKKFKKTLVADLKTMDTGFLEATLAFKSGAKITTVSATADDPTIKGVVKAARKYKGKVVVDFIGVKDIPKRAKQVVKMGVNYVCIHTSIDSQNKGKNPLDNLKKVSKVVSNKKIAVAGGINEKSISKIIKFKPEIIIVGGAITKSKNPKQAVRLLKEKLK